MKVLWLLVILVLSQYEATAQSTCCEDYCFGTDPERVQIRQFNSKTAYQIIKGTGLDKYVEVPNCTPKKIWLLSRHGTRLPSKNFIEKSGNLEALRDQISSNYKVLKSQPDKGALCLEDLLSIQTWKFNSSITPDKENFLTTQGWEDLKLLAKAYQRYYPDILTKEYNPQNFIFRHTGIERTVESFKAFSEGLFGPDVYESIHVSQPEGDDTLLRPYDFCASWEANNKIDDNSTEYNKFRYSKLFQTTLKDISTRLGFQYTLDFKSIELMWDMCRYEQAWSIDRTSAWCGAFTPGQITVLEYYEDLRYYKKSGYGYEDNAHLPCNAVKDMLHQLNSKTVPNAFAYFTHSTMIQTIVTALGIMKDNVALTAGNYASMADRKWRTSIMDPFAANLIAIKYDCPADPTDTEKVLFFLNQYPVDLPWCRVGLCDWSDVMKRYEVFYNADCSEYYCPRSGSSVAAASALSFLIAAAFYLIF